MEYVSRLIEPLLDTLLQGLPAIALEGAKGVGKTATAARRANNTYELDDPATLVSVRLDPRIVLTGQGTTFIDEWQLVPSVWNVVRRAVDAGAPEGSFLLAGSARVSRKTPIHTGAGRIVRLVMRPLSLPERNIETPAVSLADLMSGTHPDVAGVTRFSTANYISEIMASGLPGIRGRPTSVRQQLLKGYIDHIVDHDVLDANEKVRRPTSMLGWLAAYGAATGTTASYASILNAATPGEGEKPAKETAMAYRDVLQRMWILDPVPAWLPVFAHLKRLGQTPKHHLVDPALAATLVGATENSLLMGRGPLRSDTTFFGSLFESLAAQTVRVLAESLDARVSHMRIQGGDHEVDLIVETPDHRVLAIEVKASTAVRPADVAHLNWLESQVPDLILDKVLLNTGDRAYRRPDGVAVVPLALLGP